VAGFAQVRPAGVVTTLLGSATVTRAGSAGLPLQFRDNVFIGDRIETGKSSSVRLLVGGSALLLLSERSVVTLGEIPNVGTIELAAGAVALLVARERLKPGDSLEIRTPDAVARTRGGRVVAEVSTEAALAAGAPGGMASRFTVLGGAAEVIPLDTANPGPAALKLDAPQTVVVKKGTPPGQVRTATRENAGLLAASLLTSRHVTLPGVLLAPPADWTLLIDRGSGFDLWFGVTVDGGVAGDKPLDHASLATCDAVARTLAQEGTRVACARLAYLESRRPNRHRDSDNELMAGGPMAGQLAVYEPGAPPGWKLVPGLGNPRTTMWRLDQQRDPKAMSLELAACYEAARQQFERGRPAACVRLPPHRAASDYRDVRGRLMVEGPFAGDFIVHDPAPPPTSP
jgi:FecR protein